MIELLLLTQLFRLNRRLDDRTVADHEEAAKWVMTLLLSILLWPLYAVPVLRVVGVPPWLSALGAVVGGALTAFVLPVPYFIIGLVISAVTFSVLVIMDSRTSP